MRSRYVCVEGVIGVGKTTLTRLLADEFQAEQVYEEFEKNPFLLNGFYENRNAFNTEIYFLITRFQQQMQTVRRLLSISKRRIFSDYCFFKSYIFAALTLDAAELEIYRSVYSIFVPRVPVPDVIIYLTADLDTIMRRIYSRDRGFERKMSVQYIERLTRAYDEFFLNPPTGVKVIPIDTSALDIVRNAGNYAQVKAELEVVFPRESGSQELLKFARR